MAVAGIPAGAALMTAPGPGLLAVIGLMILGLAAASVFPLLTLMTPQWLDSAAGATRMVSLQVAASAAGSAALLAAVDWPSEPSTRGSSPRRCSCSAWPWAPSTRLIALVRTRARQITS